VAGSDGKSFFLFSGIRRAEIEKGKPTLEFLKDAYRFDVASQKWETLNDLPQPNAAVASPAPHLDGGFLLLGQGADGSGTSLPLNQRPSFGRRVVRYDISAGHWSTAGNLPFGVAAPGTAQWNGNTIICSGEIGPGVRSKAVWSIRPESFRGK
jgi:N-acetylneuraminic acid mutarotase